MRELGLARRGIGLEEMRISRTYSSTANTRPSVVAPEMAFQVTLASSPARRWQISLWAEMNFGCHFKYSCFLIFSFVPRFTQPMLSVATKFRRSRRPGA